MVTGQELLPQSQTRRLLRPKHTPLIRDDSRFLMLNSRAAVVQSDAYLTVPEVLRRTEAAKLCVTPTKLVPSTSTIRSFTWILGEDS